jgi:hypothetical protein
MLALTMSSVERQSTLSLPVQVRHPEREADFPAHCVVVLPCSGTSPIVPASGACVTGSWAVLVPVVAVSAATVSVLAASAVLPPTMRRRCGYDRPLQHRIRQTGRRRLYCVIKSRERFLVGKLLRLLKVEIDGRLLTGSDV